MPWACRVKQIAGEHRVERQPRERDAVPRQHDDVELQVVTELANRRILEQWTQPLQHRLRIELLGCARTRQQVGAAVFGLVSDGNIARLTIAGREGKTNHARAHRGRVAWNDAQGELAGRAQISDQCVQFSLGADERVILLNVLRRGRVVVDQRPECEA